MLQRELLENENLVKMIKYFGWVKVRYGQFKFIVLADNGCFEILKEIPKYDEEITELEFRGGKIASPDVLDLLLA